MGIRIPAEDSWDRERGGGRHLVYWSLMGPLVEVHSPALIDRTSQVPLDACLGDLRRRPGGWHRQHDHRVGLVIAPRRQNTVAPHPRSDSDISFDWELAPKQQLMSESARQVTPPTTILAQSEWLVNNAARVERNVRQGRDRWLPVMTRLIWQIALQPAAEGSLSRTTPTGSRAACARQRLAQHFRLNRHVL